MIVVDVGVIVELLVNDIEPQRIGAEALAAPYLLDSEVANALRRLVLRSVLTENQGAKAMDGFGELYLERFGARPLLPRMWELRHNLSAYEATYVVLAEVLDLSLVTTDTRMVNATGPGCSIRLL
ncbi:type II toxin-antitoxin system VapC family toxin [Arthrobacter castelli]|uniref:type II toxin-antitoxin system VapC family toxin n=1 Tax=Arthrobacter castelli TaxID=271431 RepID=UPI0003F98AA0|nr:type II toxin-antitoxin system VapC family toxin [Arthrobacter castelli]